MGFLVGIGIKLFTFAVRAEIRRICIKNPRLSWLLANRLVVGSL